MNKLIDQLQNKTIHIVGVTGSECSSILRLLRKHGISNIVAHDFLSAGSLEDSYRLWHKGVPALEREKLLKQFLEDMSGVPLQDGKKYLEGIEESDVLFVPQSWRLYKENAQLLKAKEKNIPFYSMTRLYLEYAPAFTIAVTGTVGKGSTCNLIREILKKSGKTVWSAGNDTWMVQTIDKLDEMKSSDYLVLEVSHRQLLDGLNNGPNIAVITNIHPNHLDEVTMDQYVAAKLSLITSQAPDGIAIINQQVVIPKSFESRIQSKVIRFPDTLIGTHTEYVQYILKELKNTQQFMQNIIAASYVAESLHIDVQITRDAICESPMLPARMEYIGTFSGISIYDDIKSTTPWATLAALGHLQPDVLICGGNTKGINYEYFLGKMSQKIKIVCLKSELSDYLVKNKSKYLPGKNNLMIVSDLKEALNTAVPLAIDHKSILISPAASMFYSQFIKGKASIKKLLTSLPQEAQVREVSLK